MSCSLSVTNIMSDCNHSSETDDIQSERLENSVTGYVSTGS